MNSYAIYRTENWEQYFADDACKYLSSKGYNVSVRDKLEFNLHLKNCSNWYGAIRKSIIFQNSYTGQFFAINHADQSDNVSEEIASHDLCVCIFKCQYNRSSCGKLGNKISAFTYGLKEKDEYFEVREKIKQISATSDRMYFKGNEAGCTGRKPILQKLADKGLINKDYGLRDDKGNRNQKITQNDYLENMAKSKISLSLPGAGNCCHREIEAFGIGVPVLMPVLKNSYYNGLVSDVHYIGIDTSSIKKNRLKEYNTEEANALCDMIIKKYNEVINNCELLDTIAKNAMQWFDENIAFPANIRLLEHILEKEFNYIL